MAAILQTKRLSKSYGQVAGLIDLTVEIEPGVTGLLGPNGAGKSTFLKLATGQLRPSRGSIEVLGLPPWNCPALFTRLGYCSDQDAYYSWMTGQDFVARMARLSGAGAKDARRRAQAALDLAQLKEGRERPIKTYSKGMRQKVKIAQALVHDPELLILDEPLNGLDPLGRKHVIDLIHHLGEIGVSVLCSSHVLHEIEAMTRNIVLLHQGRLLASGDIRELRTLIDRHPHHVEVVCDRPRELGQCLLELGGTRSVVVDEAHRLLTVESTEPDPLYTRIAELVLEHGFRVDSLHSPDDNLDAVFRYLVKG